MKADVYKTLGRFNQEQYNNNPAYFLQKTLYFFFIPDTAFNFVPQYHH